jgi:hypothetical protein
MTDDDDVPNFARARERVKAVLVEENLAGEDMVELLIDLIYRGVVTAGRWDWDKLARIIHLIRDRWGCLGHRWYGERATEDDADFERQLRQINEEEDERKKARIGELEDLLTAARKQIAELLGSTDRPLFDQRR